MLLFSSMWLCAEPCWRWKDSLAGSLTHGALVATLVCSLYCTVCSPQKSWETARDTTRSHFSANPCIGICRRNTFDKAFNVFKVMCLTVNIKSISIPFIKFYIEMFWFVAWESDVACKMILSVRHLAQLSRSLSWPVCSSEIQSYHPAFCFAPFWLNSTIGGS